MSANKVKGNLLEFIVRQLLFSCGFRQVVPDGHYIFEQAGSGLFFINGKGAAHDADVLMNPPIQLPFSYPSRLLFECKAYKTNVGLGVIRGAIGLRYDVNEFEIVTDDSIDQRRNNRRSTYAISNRNRYNYQVGVASVEKFSSSAFEYATNNKIPLISLRWFLNSQTCDLFSQIHDEYLASFERGLLGLLDSFLRMKIANPMPSPELQEFLNNDQVIGSILRETNNRINSTLLGLNEHGDLFFLFATEDLNREILFGFDRVNFVSARIHYWSNRPDEWFLNIGGDGRNNQNGLRFNLPDRYMHEWARSGLDSNEALNIKDRFFSRIYLFGSQFSEDVIPFRIVLIDQSWLNELRNRN